jgi:hypothetical protein
MSDPQPSQEEVVEAIYAFAAEKMRDGESSAKIRESLVEKGLDQDAAAAVVRNLRQLRSKAIASAGKKNMIYGALWCLGGLGVTAATYQAAAAGGGGKYVVAWGAIVFGAIQFFRGTLQSTGDAS